MNKKLAIISVLLAIIGAGLEVCHITNASSSPIEEPVLLKITTYMNITTVINETYHITVIGVVQNNLTTNVKSVKINATFYDAQNSTIGKSYASTELKIFKPEQRAPFTLYFSSTEASARLELVASCVKTDEEPVAGLEILKETLQNYTDEDGYHRITGEVRNNARGKAVMGKVICINYDGKGNVIALSSAFTNPHNIPSGGNASFELSSKPYKIKPASYELLVIAHHYVLVPIENYILFAILTVTLIAFVVYMKRKRGW
jgi:hypothetical protein